MKDVPATPVGSTTGANIVNIAFADYTGGFNGIECNVSLVKEGIEAVHQNGGLVKLALGGALYSMSFGFTDEYVNGHSQWLKIHQKKSYFL